MTVWKHVWVLIFCRLGVVNPNFPQIHLHTIETTYCYLYLAPRTEIFAKSDQKPEPSLDLCHRKSKTSLSVKADIMLWWIHLEFILLYKDHRLLGLTNVSCHRSRFKRANISYINLLLLQPSVWKRYKLQMYLLIPLQLSCV